MGSNEWDKVKELVILGEGEEYVNLWKALFFRPQRTMKGDFQLVTFNGHRGRKYREKEEKALDKGRLVLTTSRLIWLQKKGTIRKTLHPIFEIPLKDVAGVSVQGRFAKRVNVSDGTKEYQFRIGGDKVIDEFKKSVMKLARKSRSLETSEDSIEK